MRCLGCGQPMLLALAGPDSDAPAICPVCLARPAVVAVVRAERAAGQGALFAPPGASGTPDLFADLEESL